MLFRVSEVNVPEMVSATEKEKGMKVIGDGRTEQMSR